MKRIAEIMYIVPEEKEDYLNRYLNPSPETEKVLWEHGIHKQCYFTFGTYLLRTYSYSGSHFGIDMQAISENESTKDFFLKNRRRDLAPDCLTTTNWWAPLKWEGASVMHNPEPIGNLKAESNYHSMLSGAMVSDRSPVHRAGFDPDWSEDDWSESVHM